jgi:hypothetical protein
MPSERKKKTPFDLASVVGNIAQALASTSAPAPVSTIGELSVPFGVTFEQGQALRDSMAGRDAAQMQLYQQEQALRAEERAEAARLALDQRRMRQEKKQSKAQIEMQKQQLGLQERGLALDEKKVANQEKQFDLTMAFNEEQNRLNRALDQQQIDIAKYSAESNAAYHRASLGVQHAQLALAKRAADPATKIAEMNQLADAQLQIDLKRMRTLEQEGFGDPQNTLVKLQVEQLQADIDAQKEEAAALRRGNMTYETAMKMYSTKSPFERDLNDSAYQSAMQRYATYALNGRVDGAALNVVADYYGFPAAFVESAQQAIEGNKEPLINALSQYLAEAAPEDTAEVTGAPTATASTQEEQIPKELRDAAGIEQVPGMYGISGHTNLPEATKYYNALRDMGLEPEQAAAGVKKLLQAEKLLRSDNANSVADESIKTAAQVLVTKKEADGKKMLDVAKSRAEREAIMKLPQFARYPEVMRKLQAYAEKKAVETMTADEALQKMLGQ